MICDTEIWIMYLFKFIYILLWFYVCHTWEGLPWHKMTYKKNSSSVQSLSHVRLFATPWTAERQASLSITNSQSLPKLMSIESVMPSNHLIFCRPLFLPPSIFPMIWVFSNESPLLIRWPKYWSFSFNIISTYFLIPLRLFSFSFCDPSGNWYRV